MRPTTQQQWPAVPRWAHRVAAGSGPPALVWLVGAHGGAGVTALSVSLGFAGDAGTKWPGCVGLPPHRDSPLVVVVARTHMSGLAAVHEALLAHLHHATPDGVVLVGVLTVADTDRPLSSPVAARRATVESLAADLGAHAWRLGWVEPWRSLESHQLPAWSPQQGRASAGNRDPTVSPPPTVAAVAAQIFDTARACGVTVFRHLRDGPEPEDLIALRHNLIRIGRERRCER
ncbi:hypothetical protein [Nocardia terpenica]|uniref:Uncharacterized protein n=1 Tax=Nocardia terpenica TaxID=455432 RepID=A0A6G9ZE64_9NOCA|nr:hypothetical protein [Nocardia terpenica]QIS23637.1 hypothetical protein F6W96_40590 [Nocardia terpenica]